VLSDARDVIGIAQATQEHAGTYWAGGGMPDVVLRHPKTLGDAGKKLEENFSASYGGGQGKSRVAVLEEGMDITPLGMSKQDAQFLETRQFQRGEIAGMFQVPPHMIGDTEKTSSWGTGIEQQQIGFIQYTMRRWLVTWEQAIWMQFVEGERTYYPEFLVESLLRGDFKTQMDGYAIGIDKGVFSVNQVRRKLNEPAVDGGDVHWRPLNMAPLTQVDPPITVPPVDDEARSGLARITTRMETWEAARVHTPAPAAPSVTVTIAEGAIKSETHVAAPEVTTPITVPVTIEEGAIRAEMHTSSTPLRRMVVEKTVLRDADGEMIGSRETHTERETP
jgi:Phage portal protein